MGEKDSSIVGSCGLGLLLACGVALANHTINCTNDPCLGTDGKDVIQGTDARDRIRTLPGDDFVKGFAAAM